ncbi:MAG: hypothetical protein IJ021_05775 [Clostridia bacterium]|nr:hypothetical protein [Clostridia bacterium]
MEMKKNELTESFALSKCEDEIWHMLNRMIFLNEIYNSVGYSFYESLLGLVFDDIENFICTMQNLMGMIEDSRKQQS